jgi:hypothetical protein
MKHSRWTPSSRIAILFALIAFLTAHALDAQPSRSLERKGCPCARPFVSVAHARDTVYWLDVTPFTIPVTIGPREATKDVAGGRLAAIDPGRNLYQIVLDMPMAGLTTMTVKATLGGEMQMDQFVLRCDKPTLSSARFDQSNPTRMIASGIDEWGGLTAMVGQVYDPSSEWSNITIPGNHYQTIVTIKGMEVLNRAGTMFRNLPEVLRRAMTITEDIAPEDIVTSVYWKPGGSNDMTRWVLLLSNQPNRRAVISLEKRRMVVELATVDQAPGR